MVRWCFTVAMYFILLCIQELSHVKAETDHDAMKTRTARDIPPGEDGLIVTLEVFSGMPDPEWTIQQNHQNYSDMKSLFSSAKTQLKTYKPENAPSRLGYEGFLVQEVKKGEKLPEVLIVGSETQELQLLLLWSIPDGKISSTINSIVDEEIKSGNVSANVSAENPAKRYAPGYRPWYWNDVNVTKNNCYNYASTIKTNTFAQPGRGGGKRFNPWKFTAEAAKRSAEADGCKFTPAQKHMCAPRGKKHLVALFAYIGKYGCPFDCDYHFYRLDNNGYWSHKPGKTPATDRDGNGDRILDPREAANGKIAYKFVCFMKIKKLINNS